MLGQKAFLGVNLDLLENPKYQSLDFRSMGLYALYADRFAASMHNVQQGNMSFIDDTGVFIRFTNELAAKALHTSVKLVSKFRKQLESVGLIKIKRDGLMGYKIYVMDVEQTPSDIDLILPWKNHTISVQETVSDWTLLAKLQHCKIMPKSTVNVDATVKSQIDSTCSPKSPTSLSQVSLSQNINHNDLIDTRAREKKPSAYRSLPEKVRASFGDAFGFINQTTAVQLHDLVDKSDEDMVVYAIQQSKSHRITSPIRYLTAVIMNALKQGAKTVQDMLNLRSKHQMQQKGEPAVGVNIPIFKLCGGVPKKKISLGSTTPRNDVIIPIF